MTVTAPARRRMDMTGYGDIVTGMPSFAEKFSGADLSLTSTGLATVQYGRARRGLLSGTDAIKSGPNKGKIKEGTPADLRGVARLEWLEDRLEEQMTGAYPELVAIENYAFGSKNGREYAGEWGGVARLMLRRKGIEMITFAPSQIKKFISGNHQAEKPEVVLALSKRYGIDEPQNDKADAVILAIMAACVARPGCLELTRFQQDVIDKAEKID